MRISQKVILRKEIPNEIACWFQQIFSCFSCFTKVKWLHFVYLLAHDPRYASQSTFYND